MAQVKVTISGPAEAAQKIINLLSTHFCVDDEYADLEHPPDSHTHRLLRVEVPISSGGMRRMQHNGTSQ